MTGQRVRTALRLIAVAVIAAPVSVVLAVWLAPFWGWFEARTGIESLGHASLAPWCLLATYVLVVTVAGLVVLIPRP